jgi:hypothetical protein
LSITTNWHFSHTGLLFRLPPETLTQWLTDVISVKLPAILLVMIAALNANGQTAAPAQVQCTQPGQQAVPATQQPLKFHDVTITGSLRARGYAWDWFTPTSGNNDYQYPGNIFRINLCTTRRGTDLDVEFAVPFMFALPTNAVGTGPQQGALGFGSNYFSANNWNRNVAMSFPRQLYAKFKIAGNKDNTVQLGRFTFLDGSEITPKDDTLAALKRDRVNQRLLGISDSRTSAEALMVCIIRILRRSLITSPLLRR